MVKIEEYGIVSTEGCDDVSESILLHFINADPKGFSNIKKSIKRVTRKTCARQLT
jgi:DNA-binding HxlR family transcriptional regulator